MFENAADFAFLVHEKSNLLPALRVLSMLMDVASTSYVVWQGAWLNANCRVVTSYFVTWVVSSGTAALRYIHITYAECSRVRVGL